MPALPVQVRLFEPKQNCLGVPAAQCLQLPVSLALNLSMCWMQPVSSPWFAACFLRALLTMTCWYARPAACACSILLTMVTRPSRQGLFLVSLSLQANCVTSHHYV